MGTTALAALQTPMFMWLAKLFVADWFALLTVAYIVQTYAVLMVCSSSIWLLGRFVCWLAHPRVVQCEQAQLSLAEIHRSKINEESAALSEESSAAHEALRKFRPFTSATNVLKRASVVFVVLYALTILAMIVFAPVGHRIF